MQEKSEEFDVISVKILPSEEGDTARDPTEATLWTERVETEGEKIGAGVDTVDTDEIFSRLGWRERILSRICNTLFQHVQDGRETYEK